MKKYILLMFQKIIQIVKNQIIVLIIPNREKMALSCSKKIISIIKRNNGNR